MIFLVIAILCSASITLIFKYTQSKNMVGDNITLFNYVTATSITLSFCVSKNLFSGFKTFSVSQIPHYFKEAVAGSPTVQGSIVLTVLMGLLCGFLYLVGFLVMQVSIRHNGASMTGMFNKLGFLLPMAASILLWGEMPEAIQWGGIALAVIALVLINMNANDTGNSSMKIALLLILAVEGFSQTTSKVVQLYTLPEYKDLFLFVIFATALILCLFYIVIKAKRSKTPMRIRGSEILAGVCIGIPNLLTSFFMLVALRTIPASIAFPAASIGIIVVITVVSSLVFKEKLQRKEKLALLITMASLLMINI